MWNRLKGLATVLVLGIPAWLFVSAVIRDEPASLVIRASEPGLTAWVGSEDYPATSTPIELPPGEHQVRLTRRGELVYSTRVNLRAGERKQLWANIEASEGASAAADGPPTPDLGEERVRLDLPAALTAVNFAGEGRLALTADDAGTLRLWDMADGHAGLTIDARGGTIEALAVFDDGRRVVTASNDGRIRVWDAESGREVRSIAFRTLARVSTMAATPDGRFVATGDDQASVRVFDLVSGHESARFDSPKTSIGSLSFSTDGRRLLVGMAGPESGPHPVEVRRVADGHLLQSLVGHTGPVWGVAFLPDGRRAVSAARDRSLRVWDLDTGLELARMGGHPGAARCLAVTPDGRFAVVGTGHRWSGGWTTAEAYGVHVWDLDNGLSLGQFPTGAAVRSVALSPDGRVALAAGEDNVVRAYDMPTASPALSARATARYRPAPTATAVPNPAGAI